MRGEAKVRREHRRGEAVVNRLSRPEEVQEEERRNIRRDQRERGGREDAPCPADVELEQRNGVASAGLHEQQSRDQKAREDEENIDPDEPPGQKPDAGMAEDDQEHRHGSQPLNVGTVSR